VNFQRNKNSYVFLVFLSFLICHYKTAHLTHTNLSSEHYYFERELCVNFWCSSGTGFGSSGSIGAVAQLVARASPSPWPLQWQWRWQRQRQ
jgi:hypothetical protein